MNELFSAAFLQGLGEHNSCAQAKLVSAAYKYGDQEKDSENGMRLELTTAPTTFNVMQPINRCCRSG